MIDEVGRDMHGPRDVPSQLTGKPSNMRVPTGSGDLFRPPSLPRVPTGSGDLCASQMGLVICYNHHHHHNLSQILLFTRADLEQLYDALINLDMLIRSLPLTAETTREETKRLIVQQQKQSLPPMAKSPSTPKTGTYRTSTQNS